MKKIKRQIKILEIIKNEAIETQEELTNKLHKSDFLVTQATVSRDIRDLNLVKITTLDNKQKYAVSSSSDMDILDRLYRVFRDAVISIDQAQNIVVIKTLDGMAMAVAAALDGMDKVNIVGTIAGDDTLFSLTKSDFEAIKLISELKELM